LEEGPFGDGGQSTVERGSEAALVAAVDVPVIASGGAGMPEHFAEAFRAGASGALAASVFHDRRIAITDLKFYLADQGFEVRR